MTWLVLLPLCVPTFVSITSKNSSAQVLSGGPPSDRLTYLAIPPESVAAKEKNLIREIIEPELLLRLFPFQSRIVVPNYNVTTRAQVRDSEEPKRIKQLLGFSGGGGQGGRRIRNRGGVRLLVKIMFTKSLSAILRAHKLTG